MKSATIRLIVILALLAGAGIIITQVFWVGRAYELQEREFELNVNTALRNVATEVMQLKQTQVPNYSPVDRINPDYYVVQTNVFIEQDLLQHYLVSAFTRQNINTDFQYGLYDCMSDTVTYHGSYLMEADRPGSSNTTIFPKLPRENYYFGVYFPHRQRFIVSKLSLWIFSTLALLCVVGFLGYLLFVIFKQKRLSEVQKDFVNNMTHEFKTPLSTIQLSADVLKNPDILQNPQRLLNYATIISNESTQLSTQVERVLQMAHAEKSRLDLHTTNFVWQELLEQAVPIFRHMAEAKEGSLTLEMPEQPIHFRGDVLHLKNVIGNLLDNAIKYCDNPPRIHIFLKTFRRKVCVQVRDNGIGIDRQHQKLLFRKFYRVPTGNVHNVKGFGLGLNYVHLIMKAHGGTITCDSTPGKGTIFTLTFPAH